MIGMATISAWSAGSRPERSFAGGTVTHVATEIRSQDGDETMNKEQEGIHEHNKPSEMSFSASSWVDPAF
jgi:hypothetical protein